MRKIFFYVFLIITLCFMFSVIKILIYDIKKLTEYGYGYLTGQVLLLLISVFITIKIKPKKLVA